MGSDHKRLLIIDDDEDILFSTTLLQESKEFKVKTNNYDCDIALLTRLFSPHLIMLDYKIPHTKKSNICILLKEEFNLPLILFFSSITDPLVSTECGADGYIVKPFETESLVNQINTYIL